jgi:DNA-binding LytR/AlgR family response regulator
VEAFELEVMDYLVKPVTQERFMKAISRFNYTQTESPDTTSSFDTAYIFLKAGKGLTKIYLKDILYIEGLRDFIKVHTAERVFVASERLSYMEDKLPEKQFARVHKSFIVALGKINSLQAEQVMIGATAIPIGRVFKNEFLKKVM